MNRWIELDGFGLILDGFGLILDGFWWILDVFGWIWIYFGCILDRFWMDFGWLRMDMVRCSVASAEHNED